MYAQRTWSDFLDGINALRRDKGMAIVLIAHSKVERFDDPETVSYDRYEIDLHGKSVGAIEREMDAIFLLKRPVVVAQENQGFDKKRARANDGGAILIHSVGKPAFIAKNRYGIPDGLRYDRGNGYAALAQYLPGAKQPATDKEAA